MSVLPRRDVLALLATGAASLVARGAHADRPAFSREQLKVKDGTRFSGRVQALIPPDSPADEPKRAVVLLHGYSAGTSEQRQIQIWRSDYAVERAHSRLRKPPVRRLYETVRYLSDRRLKELNRSLSARAYQGMVLLCPQTPAPYFMRRSGPLFSEYADWLAEELLPAAQRELGISSDAGDIGIAGVSMGGQYVLEIMARRPDPFGAASAILPAISTRSARRYAKRVALSFGSSGARSLQLLTCTRDPYRIAVETLQAGLAKRGVTAELESPFGAHNSSWMRETGSLEALLFMDRALGSAAREAMDSDDPATTD